MGNKRYAMEWLEKSYHDLDSAKILYKSGHFTDTTGYVLHQSIEKIFKSFLAHENSPIIKTHNLIELNELLSNCLNLSEDDIGILGVATTYNTKQRYPIPHKKLPSKEEIKEVLNVSEYLFDEACKMLNIDKKEITKTTYSSDK